MHTQQELFGSIFKPIQALDAHGTYQRLKATAILSELYLKPYRDTVDQWEFMPPRLCGIRYSDQSKTARTLRIIRCGMLIMMENKVLMTILETHLEAGKFHL